MYSSRDVYGYIYKYICILLLQNHSLKLATPKYVLSSLQLPQSPICCSSLFFLTKPQYISRRNIHFFYLKFLKLFLFLINFFVFGHTTQHEERASLVAQQVKNPPAKAGGTGLIPGSGRSPGEGNGNLLQYSCPGNPRHRGAWHHQRATKQQLGMWDLRFLTRDQTCAPQNGSKKS